MGDDHLTVEVNFKDYTVQEDNGAWGVAREILRGYDLISRLEEEDETLNSFVNKLQARLIQENENDYFLKGTVIKAPASKWQALIIVGIIKTPETGISSPPTETSAEPEVIIVSTSDLEIIDHLIPQLSMGDRSLNDINAIVVHQTDTNTAEDTFISFQNGVGTHYLIDLDGTIYRTLEITCPG